MDWEVAWNYIVVALFGIYTILGFCFQIDIKKRKFPNNFIKSGYWLLIVFPPILGTILYFYCVVKPNRYA